LELKELAADKYRILAIVNRGSCDVENALHEGDPATEETRISLIQQLMTISENGLHNVPDIWIKCVDKPNGIFEIRKGVLRLFFFKGAGDIILVCTSIARKTTQKVAQREVAKAIRIKRQFELAIRRDTLNIIKGED